MTTLKLTLLGAVREIDAVELPPVASGHDGRPLRRFAVELHVPNGRHQELDSELQAAAAPDGQHLQGVDAAWRVSGGWTTTARVHRPGIYVYRLEVQEVQGVLEAPRSGRAAETAVATTGALVMLLDELHSQGVLSDTAFHAISAAARRG